MGGRAEGSFAKGFTSTLASISRFAKWDRLAGFANRVSSIRPSAGSCWILASYLAAVGMRGVRGGIFGIKV